MSWRDELRPASFRGVPFNAVELAGQSGRRVVADECPETDDLPPTADLGRKRPVYRMRGHVIGDDVLDQRDRILAALNADGPAELVHPWRGRLHVQVRDVSHTHDLAHGWCTIEFDAVDHGGQARPFVQAVPGAGLADQADTSTAAALAVYEDSWSGDNFRDAVYAAEIERFEELVTDVTGAFEDAVEAVEDAAALLAFVRSAAAFVFNDLGTPGDAVRAGYVSDIYDGLRVVSLIRATELITGGTYISADEAERVMADYAIELSDWMAGILDQDLFVALSDLRTLMVDALSAVSERLPRERTIEIPVPRPALVIAYDTYGTRRLAAREAEVVKLNNIGHPGFVYGPVRVLDR